LMAPFAARPTAEASDDANPPSFERPFLMPSITRPPIVLPAPSSAAPAEMIRPGSDFTNVTTASSAVFARFFTQLDAERVLSTIVSQCVMISPGPVKVRKRSFSHAKIFLIQFHTQLNAASVAALISSQ